MVTIHDPAVVTLSDLGRNFYLNESHIGKVARADASISELKDLNPKVIVDTTYKDGIEYM